MNNLEAGSNSAKASAVAPKFPQLPTASETGPGGLNRDEVKQRLAQCGYNELPEKKRNPFLEFCSHFWGPIPWMIEAAAILSALVHHWPDFIIIFVLLLANAVV